MTEHTPVYLNITDKDGILILRLDLAEYDLDKPLARASLMLNIREAKNEALEE